MNKFDIWNLDQKGSRRSTDPKQPNDKRRSYRPFLIMSPTMMIEDPNSDVICFPIQSNSWNTTFCIPIEKDKDTGLLNDSFVFVHKPYTLNKSFFRKKIGELKNQTAISSIRTSLSLLFFEL